MDFVDYRNIEITLSEETQDKILTRHPEVTIEQIQNALLSPLEVIKSNHKNSSEVYYSFPVRKNRYICVVVKMNTSDGCNYIETAYTSSTIKPGEIIYSKSTTERI